MPDEGWVFLVNVSALLGLSVGPLACLSPCPLGRVRKAGVGLWPLALTFGLLFPALGSQWGLWVF